MGRKLYLLIEEAEQRRDESIAYSDAIVALSGNPAASSVLANEMRQAAVNSELKWQAIEQMPEFRAAYSDREDAHADFLREYFSKH